jgi:hypothetical protein
MDADKRRLTHTPISLCRVGKVHLPTCLRRYRVGSAFAKRGLPTLRRLANPEYATLLPGYLPQRKLTLLQFL